jgi:hypothetical protein
LSNEHARVVADLLCQDGPAEQHCGGGYAALVDGKNAGTHNVSVHAYGVHSRGAALRTLRALDWIKLIDRARIKMIDTSFFHICIDLCCFLI